MCWKEGVRMSVAEARRPTETEAAFIRQAHQIVKDLMPHNPAIYWADFILTAIVAYSALCVCLTAPPWSAAQAVSFVVSGFALYRLSIFIHELAHLPPTR